MTLTSRRPILLAAMLLASTALAAVTRVPGTNAYYVRSVDAMTDANESRVILQEVNDTSAETLMLFFCREGRIDVFLDTKHDLLSLDDFEADSGPNVMYRVDAQQAKTIPSNSTVTDDEPDLTALAFDDARDQILVTAFRNATSKVAVRVLRKDASPLDYTFSAKGFKDALKAVNNCQ